MSLVPSQAMIFSNKRGMGDYLYFTAVTPGDGFPGAVAGGSPCPCSAGKVGDTTQSWDTLVLCWGHDCSPAGTAEPGSPRRASSVHPEHP